MVLTKIPGSLITDATITSADIQDSTITNAKMAVDPANASNLSSGDVPAAQLGNVPAVDMSSQSDDIALLAFKTQANGNLARYNLVDQSVDAFEDASGVDAIASSGEARNSAGKYYSGFEAGNYFGDDSDGTLSTSGNVTYTVPNKNGSYDGDYVLKQYTNLTINAGHTITTDQACRGLLIYVTGNCVLNGTISMDDRGASADPAASGGSDSAAVNASGLQLPMIGAGSDTLAAATFAGTGTAMVAAVANQPAIAGDGTIYAIARVGEDGGAARVDAGGYPDGYDGDDGALARRTGGGGSGGVGGKGKSGKGGDGTCFSGGPGGGAAQSTAATGVWAYGGDGSDTGGAGGNGHSENSAYGGNGRGAGGGAGNPGGSSQQHAWNGENGTGGVVWLIVKGDLSGNGTITADGSNGGGWSGGGGNHYQSGGGASGGGAIIVLCAGTNSHSGTKAASGGTGGLGAPQSHVNGGAGGDGLVTTAAVSGEGSYNNMTLVSNAVTAQAQPTKADVVLTYTNGAGTATVNTDLIASVSRDNGTTYTATTLASQGTTGGHTILTANAVDISGQPAGTSMRWKVATANQSAAKDTRIHAVSLGWS